MSEVHLNFLNEKSERFKRLTAELFEMHFKKRETAEQFFFSNIFEWNSTNPSIQTLSVERGKLNDGQLARFVKEQVPDIVITWGVGIIGKALLEILPQETWNIHSGLSPWFKGAITHFWPSYLLKPQYTGMTIHYITSKIDGGDIIHQTKAKLMKGDTLHILATRTTKECLDMVPILVNYRLNKGQLLSKKQNRTGKLWLNSDWKPEHLRVIYDLYNDSIVDRYLSGDFDQSVPSIFKQF